MECAFHYFADKARKANIPDEVLLPSQEKTRDAAMKRRAAIDLRRIHYPITYKFIDMTVFPYCEDIPEEENDRGVTWHYIRLNKDTLRFALESVISFGTSAIHRLFAGSPAANRVPSVLVAHQASVFTYADEACDPFVKYHSYYADNDWKIPSVSRRWRQDAEFARQVIGGLDPTVFTRVTQENVHLFTLKNLTPARLSKLLPEGTTLNSLIQEHRLYGITMPELTGYPAKEGHFVCDPIALFWVNERKTLMPLAIQLTQNPTEHVPSMSMPPTPRPGTSPGLHAARGPAIDEDYEVMSNNNNTPMAHPPPPPPRSTASIRDTDSVIGDVHYVRDAPPVFTPLDAPAVWLLAKMHVQCSLVTNHSVKSHLFYCHLVSETIYISMCRHLSVRHPIHAMLRPHFWYLLRLNNLARDLLASPTGILATLFGLDGVKFSVQAGAKDLDMKKHMHFPTHLASKGVTPEETKESLPDFYFRDDGLRMWGIYEGYVREMVYTLYETVEDLIADTEVQLWVHDLSSPLPHGCGLQNLPVDDRTGGVSTHEQLVELLTMILFNASVKHSAINDPQGEYVTFIPNQPMYIKIPPPPSNRQAHITEAYIADRLPTLTHSILQMSLCMNLTQLGFEASQSLLNMPTPFPASAVSLHRVFDRFKDALKQFSVEVQTRNANLDFPYSYMDPRTITQSIMM